MTIDYHNSKIYKIEPTCPCEDGDVYIGSTSQLRLCDRWNNHTSKYKKKENNTTARILFDKYGVENCRIILIEAFSCNSKEDLTAREAHFIQTILCVNIHYKHNNPYTTHKEHQKNYRKNNKDQIKEYAKEYGKKYRKNNKDKIKEYNKIYRQNHPKLTF